MILACERYARPAWLRSTRALVETLRIIVFHVRPSSVWRYPAFSAYVSRKLTVALRYEVLHHLR